IVRPDYRQIDPVLPNEAGQRRKIVGRDRNVLAQPQGSCISRRAENPGNAARLSELPHKRVFASAAADHKNFHSGKASPWRISRRIVLANSRERKPVTAALWAAP